MTVQQVQLSVLDDGSLAIEANVDELLAQWPYLSDLSLVWSLASIFQPVTVDDQADPAHQAAAAAATKVLEGAELQSWLYFNLIAHNSHVFAPVMDLVSAACCILRLQTCPIKILSLFVNVCLQGYAPAAFCCLILLPCMHFEC